MKDSRNGGSDGTQTVDTLGTGTDLTTLPQRRVSPDTFESQDYRQALELKPVGNLLKNDTTPDVANNEHWIANNTAPVSVTDFDNGQDGHHIYILGDGFTTTVHSAKIINITGADLLLDSGVIYHYVNVHGVWYQICCSSGGGGGGSVAWVDITGKPSVFPPDYVGFPPSWTDITGIPATFPPDYGTYPPTWAMITGKPATFPPDYVTYPPAWGDLTGVPAVFPPDMSSVDLGDLADVDTSGQTATMFLRYDGALWIAESVAIPSGDLSGLNDVVLTAPADGDVLTYDSGTSKWINQAPSGGGGDVYLAATQTFTGVNTFTQYASFDAGIVTHNATANRIDFGVASGTAPGMYGASTGEIIYNADAHRFQNKAGGTTWAQVTSGDLKIFGGLSLETVFPAIWSRDTDLAVDAGGLWYITAANGAFQVLKNTAAAGDFSTYQSVFVSAGGTTAISGSSLFMGGYLIAPLQVDATYGMVSGTHTTTPCKIYVGSNADPAIYADADNFWWRTQGSTNSMRLQRSGTTVNLFHLGTTGNCGTAGDPWDTVHIINAGGLYVNSVKVVGNRVTGWNAPTGAVVRGTFAVAGATAATCAGAIAAIITDLRAHGLLGT